MMDWRRLPLIVLPLSPPLLEPGRHPGINVSDLLSCLYTYYQSSSERINMSASQATWRCVDCSRLDTATMSAGWFEKRNNGFEPKELRGGGTVDDLSKAYHCPPCTIFYKLYEQLPKGTVWSTMCSNDLDPTGVRAGEHEAHFVDGRVIHYNKCALATRSGLSLLGTFQAYEKPGAESVRASIVTRSQEAWSARQQQAEASQQQQQQHQQQRQPPSTGGPRRDAVRAMWE